MEHEDLIVSMRKIHMGQPKWPVRSWFAITVWTAFRCV